MRIKVRYIHWFKRRCRFFFLSVTPTGDGRVRIDRVGARCWLVRQDGKGMGTGQDGYNYVGTKKKKPTNNTG
jgi:hypothetical protein